MSEITMMIYSNKICYSEIMSSERLHLSGRMIWNNSSTNLTSTNSNPKTIKMTSLRPCNYQTVKNSEISKGRERIVIWLSRDERRSWKRRSLLLGSHFWSRLPLNVISRIRNCKHISEAVIFQKLAPDTKTTSKPRKGSGIEKGKKLLSVIITTRALENQIDLDRPSQIFRL